jgi:hypothetical protein
MPKPRRVRVALVLLVLGVTSAALAGFAAPSRAGETIEHGSGMAGTLVAIPDRIEQGGRISAAVRNAGDARMAYGLGFGLQHRADGRWRDVRDPFTTNAVPDIGLLVPAGETAGPRYGSRLVDRFRLRSEVRPGIYRLVKSVSRGFRGPSLHLNGSFRIIRGEPEVPTARKRAPRCPTNEIPRATARDERFDATRLVGKTIKRARRLARRHDCSVRVVKRNGELLIVSQDFDPYRINVAVVDHDVKQVLGIG